jgi:hypothetical protein
MAHEMTVPEGCVAPLGDGLKYWKMIANPAEFRCEDRATLHMHVLQCEACLRKSLSLSRSAVEREADNGPPPHTVVDNAS